MSGQHSGQAPHLSCSECQERLQDYLDHGLERRESMQVYLHVRECADCAAELATLESLVAQLDGLLERDVPEDFDARILASIPYESYRAMASLRAPRVPVFLEREALPSWLTHPAVRLGGLAVTAAIVAARLGGVAGDPILAIAAMSATPQALVWLQTAARNVARAVGEAREGA